MSRKKSLLVATATRLAAICVLDGNAVSIFAVILVELTIFVNSTKISTNIEMVVLSNVSCHLA